MSLFLLLPGFYLVHIRFQNLVEYFSVIFHLLVYEQWWVKTPRELGHFSLPFIPMSLLLPLLVFYRVHIRFQSLFEYLLVIRHRFGVL